MSKRPLISKVWTCQPTSMMHKHMSLPTNTLKALKSIDCMYGTRNIRLSCKTKRDHFSYLLSTITQTNILNTYIEPTPLWQDTHEVSQGLEHVDLDPYVYGCITQMYVSARLFFVYLSNHASDSKTRYINGVVSPWGTCL